MTKNLKSFLLLLMAGMFGMLLTVSCGADDVLSDVEDATGTDEPASADETPQWTEQTKMAAKELVGKWQMVYYHGDTGKYDAYLEVLEDGTVMYNNSMDGSTYSWKAKYELRNDWELTGSEERETLVGHISCPERAQYNTARGRYNDFRCILRTKGESNYGQLYIYEDIPGARYIQDPGVGFNRIE